MAAPFVLVILDGFGYSQEQNGNAIAQAQAPFLKKMMNGPDCVLLKASGPAVGLPEGQMGNSQVGHLTIGAGRRIPGMLLIINQAIQDGSFFNHHYFQPTNTQLANAPAIHLIGLLSDGGIHSSIYHLEAWLKALRRITDAPILVHAILDGRDVAPRSAAQFLMMINPWLQNYQAQLGSIQGRYYAMDRDRHWDRTEQAFDMLTEKASVHFPDWAAALEYYYAATISDEFLPPTQLDAMRCIKVDDAVIFFNFRPERMRQLIERFIKEKSQEHASYGLYSMIDVADTVPHLFTREKISGTLKEKLAAASKRIFTIAETEKYAHVTYFFDGHRTESYPGELRVMIPSKICRSYADNPCMAAPEITQTLIKALEQDMADFYLANYANADMVGHTGNLKATIQALECLDGQLAQLAAAVEKKTWHLTHHGRSW
jgi:2,3-bisphosphoglycerate-independent phosphoglycerate mutase